jgi:hypothetical protein
VDVVDVVLNGSGIDEKFLGVTLFALVPNTTEFMNAVSFAMNGNIALRYVLTCSGPASMSLGRTEWKPQYGNRLSIRPSSVPSADPCDGSVLGMVRSCSDG